MTEEQNQAESRHDQYIRLGEIERNFSSLREHSGYKLLMQYLEQELRTKLDEATAPPNKLVSEKSRIYVSGEVHQIKTLLAYVDVQVEALRGQLELLKPSAEPSD